MADDTKRLAVLIDAENATAVLKVIDELMSEIETLGPATVKRIYGDFSQANLPDWNDKLLKYSIQPIQQLRNTVTKNGSDIALVIDAMDLLHRGKIDGFCIVSGDSDFTGLARRIREDGLPVYGFGQKANAAKTSFVPACTQFFPIENFGKQPLAAKKAKSSTTADSSHSPLPLAKLREAFEQVKNDDGWARQSDVGAVVKAEIPGFKVKKYGYRKFTELLRESGLFHLERRPTPTGKKQDWVKLRTKPGNGA